MTVPDPDSETVPFGFCTITGIFDRRPQFRDTGWDGLIAHLRSHVRVVPVTRKVYDTLEADEQRNHKNGPGLILAQFKRPGVRADDEVLCTFALGLDIDEAHVELADLKRMLAGTSAVVYESLRSQPTLRRWRVFIEYARPLSPEEHARAFEHWSSVLPGVGAASRNPSRLWFGVQRFKGSEQRIFEVLPGSPYEPQAQRPATSSREAFLRKIAPPVDAPASEGDRNSMLSRYCASLLAQSTVQDEEELLGALLEKNDSYDPPLPEKEVRTMARAKWRQRAKFGWVEQAGSPDEPPAEDADLGFDLSDLIEHDPGEVPWLVEGVLTHGAHLLVGRPKGGKSWVTLDLVFGVASGGTFIDRQCQRSGVLWITAEDTQATLARRLRVRGQTMPRGACVVMTMEKLEAERERWEDVSFDEFLRAFLEARPDIGLVVMDTHKTCEALWAHEQIDRKRNASVVDIAYQDVRRYESIGQATETCVVLVHHAGKMKNNRDVDYHERINLPATAVAGATASLVLADPPDRDIHDEDDHRRVLAIRGRHILREAPLLIELKAGRVKLEGEYHEIVQSEAQAETLAELEMLLGEQGWPEQEAWVTYKQIAQSLGKHEKTVAGHFKVMKKDPAKMVWKGHRVVIKQRQGVTLI